MMKILCDLYKSKEVASIYTNDQDTDKFHYGKVLAVNENEIAIQMISPDGNDDGIISLAVECVFRVDIGGQYAQKMEKLYSEDSLPDYTNLVDNDNIFMSLLSSAMKYKQIVSLELINSGYNDIVGVVEEIKDNECIVKVIDEYGNEDGLSYVLFTDITKIAYSTEDEKRMMLLYKPNK